MVLFCAGVVVAVAIFVAAFVGGGVSVVTAEALRLSLSNCLLITSRLLALNDSQ